MLALIHSAFLEPTHLQMRKLNPDERYRRSCRRTTSRPLSNWTDSTDREREGDRESLVLVHSLGSPARFVPWEIYKRWSYKKLGCSERGEERAKHILQTQRFGIQNASEWLEPPKSFSYIQYCQNRRQGRGAKRESCNFDSHVAHLVHV